MVYPMLRGSFHMHSRWTDAKLDGGFTFATVLSFLLGADFQFDFCTCFRWMVQPTPTGPDIFVRAWLRFAWYQNARFGGKTYSFADP